MYLSEEKRVEIRKCIENLQSTPVKHENNK